ncbi:MAG: phosphatidylserine decarboxylase, partial [Burkholderiaceae bacterium]
YLTGTSPDEYIGKVVEGMDIVDKIGTVKTGRGPGGHADVPVEAVVIQDAKGRSLTCIQIAGLIARRILCYVQEGDAVQRGMRYGFIRFGSRVDIYMPVGSRPLVSLDDKVSAHSTALALWPDDAQDAGHANA